MKKRDNRAVSPLIATVILIAIVISASSIIYVWSKSFIAESLEKFGNPVEIVCDELTFEAQLDPVGGYDYDLWINNRANVDIHKLNLNFKKEGKSVIKTFSADGGAVTRGSTGKITLNLEDVEGIRSFDSIDVTPVLLATGGSSQITKLFPCEDKTINVVPSAVQS